MIEWISVDERLPENKESVLVSEFDDYGNNGMTKAWFGGVNWHLDDDGLRATDDHCIYLNMKVTHWMPLPKPPTE